jgi:hypothetical protein
MIEELRRRDFAETTIRSYVHGVEHFSRYFIAALISLVRSTFASARRCCSAS